MASSVPDADFPAIEYDLNIHEGEVTTVVRLRDSGIRLAGDRIEWRIDRRPQREALADIKMIRLRTAVETARGPMGGTSCQIRFRGGWAVTVFGGNSLSPDADERQARYEAFVTELHRRLGPDDRAHISFIAGYGGARFYFSLVATVVIAVLWVTATVGTLLGFGPRRIGAVIGGSVGAIMTLGMFRLLQLNAPHIYDPRKPIGSARAGSIGDTLGQAIGEIRQLMTLARELKAAAIAAVVIMIFVVIVASHQRVSLFEPGRARLAFDAVLAQTGPNPTVTYVSVTPGELLVETPEDPDSTSRIDWRASRRTLFGWSEWDDVSGPTVRHPMSVLEELGDQQFKLDLDDTAHLDDLVKAAVARAALGPGSAVTQMTLIAPHAFIKPEPARWTVEIDGPGGHAKLYADRTGTLFPPTPEPAGPPRIVIRAVPPNAFGLFPESGTWFRLINPDQTVRFDSVLKFGDSYRVPDIPGIRLQTGDPQNLDVTVDGRPARLPPAGYAGRVDAVLDPQSLLVGAEGQK